MNFEYSTAHKSLREDVRKFVDKEVLPVIAPHEKESTFPIDIFQEMGRRGFLKTHVDARYGGGGLGTLGFCLVSEEIAKAGAGMTHNGHHQLTRMLIEYGGPQQKQKYLDKMLNGKFIGAMAITEPAVGSSFREMETEVELKGATYILTGVKSFINDAAEANVIGVFARSRAGYSILLLDRETPGFRILRKLDPIGFRNSPVYDFEMKECELAPDQLLGSFDGGLEVFFSAFNFSRLGNASAALGIGDAAFVKALNYIKTRRVGKHSVSEFQGIRWCVAEMSVRLQAARLLRDRAASLTDNGDEDMALEASQAKFFCVETANDVVGQSIQMTGRHGCLRDSLFELYLRDARALGIAGGTLEVMKNNIAKKIIGN